jgi:hypothetical protein
VIDDSPIKATSGGTGSPLQAPSDQAGRTPSWSRTIGPIELVWHRANTAEQIAAFLRSDVRWIECDARADPNGVVSVAHEPVVEIGEALELTDWLDIVREAGRSAKIDLKEGGVVLDGALEAVSRVGLQDVDLWFNAAVEIPGGAEGFTKIRAAHADARISCPLDTLASYLLVAPPAYEILSHLRSWGMDWLCMGVCVDGVEQLIPQLRRREWSVNLWDVEDASDMRRALALSPTSITADLSAIEP